MRTKSDFINIDKSKLFRKLLRVRMVEEELVRRHSEQEMRCPIHFCIGREAIAVALCESLKISDYTVSTHRAHAHYLTKGGSLYAMISEFYGKSTGCAAGRGGSMHLIDRNVGFVGCVPIVGSTIPIGVGLAFGSMLQKNDKVTVIFFGDGSTEEGAFYESLNFALMNNLRVIFMCENDFYAVSTHITKRRRNDEAIIRIVEGFGIGAYRFDGQDCNSLAKKLASIVDDVRSNGKPVFVQCDTYRYTGNCGPESDSRPDDEVSRWKERDPVKLMQEKLLNAKVLSTDQIEQFKAEIAAEIQEAFDKAQAAPFPLRPDLNKFVFKDASNSL
ncbi:MAG: thiamine pyrophosphate-dependent dehydrogenase E1 component subunit alpha [Holosporales bacterium]|nr:thiamine pyrophosphate-dependent dehydrogenase E1 component subunit alpha [Holosporales bacterium]